MRDSLLTRSKPEILWIFRHINGGTVGFDFEPIKTPELVDRLFTTYTEEQIQSAISNGIPANLTPKGVATDKENRPVPTLTMPTAP